MTRRTSPPRRPPDSIQLFLEFSDHQLRIGFPLAELHDLTDQVLQNLGVASLVLFNLCRVRGDRL